MGRNTTRTQNLTRINTVGDNDVITIGPASGERAKGIIFSAFSSQIGGGTIIVEITGNYAVTLVDDFVAVTGTALVTLPLSAVQAVTIKCIAAPVTVTPSAGTIDGQASVILTLNQSLSVFPIVAGWAIT